MGPQPWWQVPLPAFLCAKSKLGTFQNSKQAFNALERPQHKNYFTEAHVTRAHKEKQLFRARRWIAEAVTSSEDLSCLHEHGWEEI